jgi:gamma-glutamyltranspeptidase/glutathione hydrolase
MTANVPFAPTHRPLLMAETGMVVSGHPLASAAGAAILRRGGNAMDAAVATAATLAIAIPFMNGLGGDAIALWANSSGEVTAINGSGRTPAAATVEHMRALGLTRLPRRGPLSVSVPGVVAAWGQSLERFGTMEWADVLAPAIHLAETGVPLDRTAVKFFNGEEYAALAAEFPDLGRLFVPPASASLGQRLRQPAAARTLQQLAAEGWRGFYTGSVAEKWLPEARKAGVLAAPADLAVHETLFTDALSTWWMERRVHVAPPNSQGIALIAMLGLEGNGDEAGSPAIEGGIDPVVHLRRKLSAFSIRDAYCSDPDRVRLPSTMLSAEALAALEWSARPPVAVTGGGDTSTLVVIDAEGNAVSWAQSLFEAFGSGVACPSSGIVLHNRMMMERLDDDPVRGLLPGKRPFHTLAPAMVTAGGRVDMAIATPGDHGQTQSLLQVLRHHYQAGLDLQAAIERPRLRHDAGKKVLAENRVPAAWSAALKEAGWELEDVGPWSRLMGGVNAIRRMPDGLLMGGADPRRECYAVSA